MTPDDMAYCHARAFEGRGQVWTASEIAELLTSPHVFAVGDARCFAMGRVVAGEAELLTLASDPAHQGQGLGRACLADFETEARIRNAEAFFLEVADDNIAAQALYQSAGYTEAARRKGYYPRQGAAPVDALILSKSA
ncbi:GNAT family N-acetyltransferase [Roseovarius sp. A21]|uniref:GNAT family N-acetyltransferase n=1 Tax=Roseovarius bejariae TaxID=2576383 RepID=A0A844CKP4_9RHOB|nr:GNAT family N-acetyltransferase [Roseovarius bejariae]MRU15222.1 GNAT family N-acetyltransferase [Roseovarius bejariae]